MGSENFKVGSDATRPNLIVSNIGRGEEERIKKLEQRVGDLEQKLDEDKAARERLLASVERALVGEEASSEFNLVQLIQDIKTKIMRQGEKILSLDLNGNEAPPEGDAATKRCKSGSPNIGKILHAEVGLCLKTRPVETPIIAKPHPGFLPRPLALGIQNKSNQGDARNTNLQKPGGPVEKELSIIRQHRGEDDGHGQAVVKVGPVIEFP